MNKEKLKASNKLIAEFMELKPTEWRGMYSISHNHCTSRKNTPKEALDGFASIAKYHSSWDWLMPVVDKIESIIFDEDNSFNVTIGSTNYCVIQDSHGEVYDAVEDYKETKLLTTYSAVVEFIKWYNENKDQ